MLDDTIHEHHWQAGFWHVHKGFIEHKLPMKHGLLTLDQAAVFCIYLYVYTYTYTHTGTVQFTPLISCNISNNYRSRKLSLSLSARFCLGSSMYQMETTTNLNLILPSSKYIFTDFVSFSECLSNPAPWIGNQIRNCSVIQV